MMIVVKIEIWPFGNESKSEELGRIHIVNDGSSDSSFKGSYDVYAGDPHTHFEDAFDSSRVEGYDRDLGFWLLFKQAIKALF